MESPRRTSLDYYDSIHDLLHVSIIDFDYIRFFLHEILILLSFFIDTSSSRLLYKHPFKRFVLKYCCFRHTRSYKQQRFYLYIDILYTDTRTEVQQ